MEGIESGIELISIGGSRPPGGLISRRIAAHPGSILVFFQYLCFRSEDILTLFPLAGQTAPALGN